MNIDVEFHIRHNYPWGRLPASVKQVPAGGQGPGCRAHGPGKRRAGGRQAECGETWGLGPDCHGGRQVALATAAVGCLRRGGGGAWLWGEGGYGCGEEGFCGGRGV